MNGSGIHCGIHTPNKLWLYGHMMRGVCVCFYVYKCALLHTGKLQLFHLLTLTGKAHFPIMFDDELVIGVFACQFIIIVVVIAISCARICSAFCVMEAFSH